MPVGVDVGGTFTDVAIWDGETLIAAKVPTTPDQSEGVMSGIAVAGATGAALIHGTTAATNAVLERAGARVAFVADEGFEDLIEIGRQDRPSLYDTAVTRPEPLVPAQMRFGAPGRAAADDPGVVGDLDALVEAVREAGPEAVAVSLLFGFAHPQRERRVAEALREALGEVPVSLSSDVAPEVREFERASTTILNSYVAPATWRYLRRLADLVTAAGATAEPMVMRSSGGLIGMEEASRLPASILLSGPAGGVVAAAALGDALGLRTLISFDMGGTSTDVCRIEGGRPGVAYRRPMAGYACTLPSVAIHTVGAGGGSIGWIDPGGALRVGPASAGAHPGPAAYGRGGTLPTVTDADLQSGRLGADTRLAGTLPLDAAAATRSLDVVGGLLGIDALEVAAGMVEVVEAHMERAVRRVSVEEGADPRGASLMAFGGAGGLHATALARRLGMGSVVIPPHAGVFSALGLLLAPPRVDLSRSVVLDGMAGLDQALGEIADAARRALPGARVEAYVDLRYRGQSHETTVVASLGESREALLDRFHGAHRRLNGFAMPGEPVEVVTVRAEATGTPALDWERIPPPVPEGEAAAGWRAVLLGGSSIEASVWRRSGLRPGDAVVGPAVVEEARATTFLGVGERAVVHESGALVVELP